MALGDVGEAGDEGAALLEGDVDGRVGEGVGAELAFGGNELVLGDDLGAPDEGVEVGQDTLGDILGGAWGFGESALSIGIEEARILAAYVAFFILERLVDDALDSLQGNGECKCFCAGFKAEN